MAFDDRNDLTSLEQTNEAASSSDSKPEHDLGPISTSARTSSGAARPNNNENMTEDFATALESFEQEQAELAANEDRVLKGTVVSVNQNYLVVDIGLKSEGVVPIAEVQNHEGTLMFNPGDSIDVMIEKGHTEE